MGSRLRRIASAGIIAAVVAASTDAFAAICDVSAFSCPASGTCVVSGIWVVGEACVLDFGNKAVELTGTLQAETTGGSFEVRARQLTLTGGKLKSQGDSDDPGGNLVVIVSETFRMQGTGPRLDVAGNGGGGIIAVYAGAMELESGLMTADGGSGQSCGNAGFVILEALDDVGQRGPISLGTTLSSSTPGQDCRGGVIQVAGSSVTATGEVDARGGAGADVDAILLAASAGDVVVTSSAGLQADGTGQPGGSGAEGGTITLSAIGGAVLLEATPVSATGKAPDGIGGALFVFSEGDAVIDADVELSGHGSAGLGGELYVSSFAGIELNGDVSATGGSSLDGEGGLVTLDADAGIVVTSTVDVSGANGGGIDLSSFDHVGPVTVTGTLRARGVRGLGGIISADGCGITISGTLDANAPIGGEAQSIELTAAAISITGTALLTANPCPPASSCMLMKTNGTPPSIAGGATVSPAPTLSASAGLPSC